MRDQSVHSYRPYDDEDDRPIAEYLDSAKANGVKQTYEMATAYLNRHRMDQPDFFRYADTFDSTELNTDFRAVATQQSKQRKSPEDAIRKMISGIHEAITHKGIGSLQWFGDNSSTIDRNDYDDLVLSTDVMAVHRQRNAKGELKTKTVLGIDVTTSEHSFQVKLETILTKIDYMPETLKYKYFVDKETDRHGSFVVPQIVLYSPLDEIVKRFPEWINHDKDSTPLQNDPLQMEYLQQALLQTTLFMNKVSQAAKASRHPEYRMQAYKDLMKRYANNVKLIRTTLVDKAKTAGKYPVPTQTLRALAEATGVRPSTLKQYALGSETDPILRKIIERLDYN